MKEKSREPRVQSVARAVGVLMAVAKSPSGLKGSDISAIAKLPKQATYHLIHTLVTTGMLTRNEQGLYVLGLRVGTLAEGFRRQLAPPEHLAPIVRRIAQQTGETAYASGWWNGEIATLAIARGSNPVQVAEIPLGTFMNAHARAAGKLLLAFATRETRLEYLASHPLEKQTKNTITSSVVFTKELERIKSQGYAEDDEEFARGISGYAVPIDYGSLPYAVTVSAPSDRFAENAKRYLEIMLDIAGDLAGTRRPYRRSASVA